MELSNLNSKISKFQDLLNKISISITSGKIFESLHPSEIWKRTEQEINSIQEILKSLKEMMLLLKPEKAADVKEIYETTMKPLHNYIEVVTKTSEENVNNSNLALENLKKLIEEGTNFLDLAKNISQNPNKVILEVLKLKEVYKAKNYLTSISAPQTLDVRFESLKINFEKLRNKIDKLKNNLVDLDNNLILIEDSISKFKTSQKESGEKRINIIEK